MGDITAYRIDSSSRNAGWNVEIHCYSTPEVIPAESACLCFWPEGASMPPTGHVGATEVPQLNLPMSRFEWVLGMLNGYSSVSIEALSHDVLDEVVAEWTLSAQLADAGTLS